MIAGYGIYTVFDAFTSKEEALLAVLAIGVGKELYDAACRCGTPDMFDVAATMMGSGILVFQWSF